MSDLGTCILCVDYYNSWTHIWVNGNQTCSYYMVWCVENKYIQSSGGKSNQVLNEIIFLGELDYSVSM